MIRFFRLVLALMVLGMAALISAAVTMRLAIHGAEVAVPDLKGLTLKQAVRKTSGEGLNLSVDNKFYSSEVPAGGILTQSPIPGTVVRREWRVRVTESLGPQRVTIPNVIGKQERIAAIEVHRLGLELDENSEMPFPNLPPGVVIAQNPQNGSTNAARPSMSLLISSASTSHGNAFVMPQLVGMPYSTAAAAITRAGFKIGPMMDDDSAPDSDTTKSGAPMPPGLIETQSPAAGSHVDGSTYIALTISQ